MSRSPYAIERAKLPTCTRCEGRGLVANPALIKPSECPTCRGHGVILPRKERP